jgi:ubiquinone/menaquinone biosynthesis C-methylase UbiE
MGSTGSTSREGYSMGYSEEMHQLMAARTAAVASDFLLPHLRPGMRLLDVGCGPGSITLGLAAAVAPGPVVGVDVATVQLERARTLATEQRASNIRFEEGDAYALPFPDDSFDVVNANALLQHLGDPVRALREFRRVLRPGGIAVLSDPDWSTWIIEPATPALDLLRELWLQVFAHNGGDACYARHQRRLMLEAGFAHAECFPSVRRFGTPESVREHTRNSLWNLRSVEPTIIAAELAYAESLASVADALQAWGERPDATAVIVAFRSIGWVDPPERW